MAPSQVQRRNTDDNIYCFVLLVAMLLLFSPTRCFKSFGVSNPDFNSLYLVWASVVRVDLAYGKQTEEFMLRTSRHDGLAAARFSSF